ncbi:MAG: hypothetical protein E3J72_00075 [Planctomycetota bacterium]|nr:MAG: hypothetical protein E3J72_00075 [Planctomycetota bacterium]
MSFPSILNLVGSRPVKSIFIQDSRIAPEHTSGAKCCQDKTDRSHEAALLGVGHLGGALPAYSGFASYGLAIVAAFDKDKEKTGKHIAGCTVKPIKGMKAYIMKRGIRLAILTTHAETAQGLTDRLVSAGIRAI